MTSFLLYREYEAKVLPIQDRLVKMKSYEKVMTHLSHPNDEVAVEALGFLRVVLYLGNTEAQKNIGHLTVHQNTKFFIRISQLLEGVISSLGRPVLKLATLYNIMVIISNSSGIV